MANNLCRIGKEGCNCAPKGAFIRAQWNSEAGTTSTFDAYVSFGTLSGDETQDSFGVDDDEIFFYFTDIQDMNDYLSPSGGRGDGEDVDGFKILSYELVPQN